METLLRNEQGIDVDAFISIKDKLPRFGQWVMVAAPYACRLGFLGPGGVWRDARHGERIDQVESWQPLNADTAPASP